jgi:hypothetical protein
MLRRRSAIVGICAAVVLVAASVWPRSAPDGPQQPIDFSHRAHLVADNLDCEYCHSTARRAALAGVPPVERCMGCHRFVATRHPEVLKLTRYWERRIPIAWVQVNVLPRFVRFTHEAHERANVPCQQCHGAVEQMDRVSTAHDLTMGWCVGCHRERRAPVDCLTCHY